MWNLHVVCHPSPIKLYFVLYLGQTHLMIKHILWTLGEPNNALTCGNNPKIDQLGAMKLLGMLLIKKTWGNIERKNINIKSNSRVRRRGQKEIGKKQIMQAQNFPRGQPVRYHAVEEAEAETEGSWR